MYNFDELIVRQELSSRGGGIEITITPLGFPGGLMSAYQNYLGGGLLGRILSDNNVDYPLTPQQEAKLSDIEEALKKYFHGLTNPNTEWEGMSYESNQTMPVSAY